MAGGGGDVRGGDLSPGEAIGVWEMTSECLALLRTNSWSWWIKPQAWVLFSFPVLIKNILQRQTCVSG